LRKCI